MIISTLYTIICLIKNGILSLSERTSAALGFWLTNYGRHALYPFQPNALQGHGPSLNLHVRSARICDEARLRLGRLLEGLIRHADEESLPFGFLREKVGWRQWVRCHVVYVSLRFYLWDCKIPTSSPDRIDMLVKTYCLANMNSFFEILGRRM
jgi:hypothetical protein